MRTHAGLVLLAFLSATALGCREYSLRLRNFHDRHDRHDAAMPDASEDAGSQTNDASDASDDAPSNEAGQPNPTTCDELTCTAHAACKETSLGPRCECFSGYEDRSGTCANIDECTVDPNACDPLTRCEDSDGYYECSACPATYGGKGRWGCRPLLMSLEVTPLPEVAPVALDVALEAHLLSFPLSVEQVGITATFAAERSVKMFDNPLTSGEMRSSPMTPGPNWVQLEVREGMRMHSYFVSAQRGQQEAYIKANESELFDQFGASVAISGDTLVVGALTGVAYVFVRSGSTWSQEARLAPIHGSVPFRYGSRVAIDGDTIALGAAYESSVPNSPESNLFGLPGSGAVYVFVRSEGVWSQQAMLKASNASENDFFGRSLSISNETIVVGAPGEDGTAETAMNSGAAYVFVRDGDDWTEQAYLKASSPGEEDSFGLALALSGDTLVVGAPNDAADAPQSGAAYVFTRTEGVWAQTGYLKSSNPEADDLFGAGLAFDGSTLVISAPGESSSEGGVDSADADTAAAGSGAAYVFVQEDGHFTQDARLKAHFARAEAGFGLSVAVQGPRMLIGASDASAVSLFAVFPTDDAMPLAGAAYLFERAQSGWQQLAYVKPAHPGAGDSFASPMPRLASPLVHEDFGAVAIEGDTLVVGAPGEDSDARGIDGDADNDETPSSGAVYVFR